MVTCRRPSFFKHCSALLIGYPFALKTHAAEDKKDSRQKGQIRCRPLGSTAALHVLVGRRGKNVLLFGARRSYTKHAVDMSSRVGRWWKECTAVAACTTYTPCSRAIVHICQLRSVDIVPVSIFSVPVIRGNKVHPFFQMLRAFASPHKRKVTLQREGLQAVMQLLFVPQGACVFWLFESKLWSGVLCYDCRSSPLWMRPWQQPYAHAWDAGSPSCPLAAGEWTMMH